MKWLFLSLLCFTINASAQTKILLPGEEVVFSFKTTNNKEVVVAKSKSNQYLVYRFGSSSKVELEYPSAKDTTSWKKFSYSYWLRGGGPANEGIDLNYLYFISEDYRYVVYHTYFSVDEKSSVGVKVTNMKTGKTIDIPGNIKSVKGNLVNFRDSLQVAEGDELFD
jgi:hypothetical protein